MDRFYEYHSPIYEYVKTNRGVGHTTLIKDGGINAQYPFFIVGKDMSHAKHLANEMGNRFGIPVSMQNADNSFRGKLHPVLIDNYVFTETCEGYIRTIRDYREENQRLREEIEHKQNVITKIGTLPLWVRLFKGLYQRAIMRANEKGR